MSAAERLVGRDSALAAIESILRDTLAGTGQFLLIGGEAGIGKTALLAAAIERAGSEWCVVRGLCWDGDGAPPYWPWTQVLRATGLSIAELDEARWLLETGPDSTQPMSAAAATDAQFRMFDAVSRSLIGLAADGPVLVVLDDLQWADEPSVRLLGFLARNVATSRVLLIGAYRDTEASTALMGLAGRAQHLILAGLGTDDVATMLDVVAGPAPASVSSQLWQRTGGNPFFVRELVRLLVAQGQWQVKTNIPVSVSDTLRRRLARLSTGCVRLLDWAAVAGREIDTGLLVASGAAVDETEVLRLTDEARRAGVVIGAGDETRFAHDLYRETILAGLSSATSVEINLALGCALQQRRGNAARVAAHLLAAGASAQRKAVEYSILAAREATARLGHDDACAHYLRAVRIIDSLNGYDPAIRIQTLLELAAAYDRAGKSELARERYLAAADAGRRAGDATAVAHAALGLQALGNRSGAQNAVLLELLGEAAQRLDARRGPFTLQSEVLAALARTMRHSSSRPDFGEITRIAHEAADLAAAAKDPRSLAVAMLALHDSLWRPGSARQRLPVVTEMLDVATQSGDDELVANAHQLLAAAMLELGDPAGRNELLTYITLSGKLGHARGRWAALTRQATFAQIAGQAEESARFSDQALELGLAIGEPDAIGCFCTSRWSLVALGVPEPDLDAMDTADPLWPMFRLFAAWPLAVRGELDAAASALGDFSVLDISEWTGLEGLAAAAVVFAAVGSSAQRSWVYEQLSPYAGTHVVVGGCASYHAAVDHHLGALAAALGNTKVAEEHFRTALEMHQRLGAAGWARLSEQALSDVVTVASHLTSCEFSLANDLWRLSFRDKEVQMPDSKGLRDISVLICARGAGVHVFTLLGNEFAGVGADPVIDDTAKAQFKKRIRTLEEQIADAEHAGHPARSEQLRVERDALIHELAAAAGLGGRTRRLGDQTERARKTVSARVRDAVSKIDRMHPDLADHLRGALRMGTVCSYQPREPTTWTLTRQG